MKNKVISLLGLMLLLFKPLSAQNWLWAHNFTGNTFSQFGAYIASVSNGNIYSFGGYEPGGTVVAGNASISSNGLFNSFVSEFDPSGNFVTITNVPCAMVTPTGNGGVAFTSHITTDENNNLYACLRLTDNSIIDTIQAIGSSPTTPLYALSKWNENSRCIWVKYYTGLISSNVYNNSIYIVGNYQEPVLQIDTFQINDPANKQQGYLAKLDAAGSCKWLKQATGGNTEFDYLGSNNNHIYVSAHTDSCFVYDTVIICGSENKGAGFVMELDTNGGIIWYKKITGLDFNNYPGFLLAAINSGGLYHLGSFDTTLYLGHDTLQKLGSESADYYIAKYNDSGDLLWVKQMPVSPNLAFASISVDSLGYLNLTGYITGSVTLGNYTVNAQSTRDLIVTRVDPNGDFIGVVTVPNAQALDITEDRDGNEIVTGFITNTATFGSIVLNSSAQQEFFIAKLSAITDSSTGFSSLLPADSLLQIYTNPSRGLFTIAVPETIVQANNGNLIIYDSQSSLITNRQVNISSSHLQVDLGEINRGVYTVVLMANGKEFRGRVVIQ